MSLNNGESEFEGELRIETSGAEVTYRVIQLQNRRCEEGYLEFPHNESCLGVKECGEGFFRSGDKFGRV